MIYVTATTAEEWAAAEQAVHQWHIQNVPRYNAARWAGQPFPTAAGLLALPVPEAVADAVGIPKARKINPAAFGRIPEEPIDDDDGIETPHKP